MNFFKSFLACLCAILVSGFILSVFVFAICMSAMFFSSPKSEVTDNSVLCISLEGNLEERAKEDIYGRLLGSQDLSISLEQILSTIKSAKEDDRIKGIYLKPGVLSCGYASLEEIRAALADFKTSGKFIYSYSGRYTQGAYYVASAADSVFLNPQGVLDFRGVAASSVFYKHLFDTLGVEMQVIKVGTYKSFTEQYTNDSMSAPNREQTQQMVTSLWNSVLDKVSVSRRLSKGNLNELANQMMAFQMPHVAVENRMIDGLKYGDEMEDVLKKRLSLGDDEKVNLVRVSDYYEDLAVEKQLLESEKKIAVLYAVGEIDNGNTDGISSAKLVSEIRKIKEDKSVKALLVRVNSPGGSAYGAEQIWRALELAKEKMPVIVSMGDYAASGGYYLSAGADCIFADETTITGSIGVFSVIPNVQKLLNKVGVKQEVVKTNPYSDVLSNFTRPLDETERTILQNHVAEVYSTFLDRCADGRHMDKSEVEKIAEGRVWCGSDALKIGLVDRMGTLEDAIRYTANYAQLGDDYEVESYPKEKDIWSQLSELPHLGYEKIFKKEDIFAKEKALIFKLESLDMYQALMPYNVSVK